LSAIHSLLGTVWIQSFHYIIHNDAGVGKPEDEAHHCPSHDDAKPVEFVFLTALAV
jgi:hypothetical protein